MRGRTNIGGGGIAINATVEQKEIKSGNIIAGDFVEYYSTPTSISLSSFVNFKFEVNGYLIGLVGTTLVAFKNGRQVASYVEYTCSKIGQCGNFVIFYDNNLRIVGVLSIENDTFTLLDTYTTSDDRDANAIWGANGKICYVSYYQSGSTLYVGVLDVSNNGVLSNYYKTTLTNVSSNSNSVYDVAYYNGYFYVIFLGMYAGVSIKLSIDGSNQASIVTTINNIQFQYGKNFRTVYKKNQIIAIASYEGDTISTSTSNQGYLGLLNFVTGNGNTKTLQNFGEVLTIINDSLLLTSARNYSSNTYFTYTINLCSFNDSTLELSILDTIELSDKTYGSITKGLRFSTGGIKDNIVYVQLKGGQSNPGNPDYTISLFEVINNELKDITQKNYVQTYGNGNPIGVAKDSGVAGDIIDVYVPVPTT